MINPVARMFFPRFTKKLSQQISGSKNVFLILRIQFIPRQYFSFSRVGPRIFFWFQALCCYPRISFSTFSSFQDWFSYSNYLSSIYFSWHSYFQSRDDNCYYYYHYHYYCYYYYRYHHHYWVINDKVNLAHIHYIFFLEKSFRRAMPPVSSLHHNDSK